VATLLLPFFIHPAHATGGVAPSEQVVALALRECLPEFIAGFRKTNPLAKIISENLDVDRAEGFRLAS
jgi:hypothetical protein